MRFRRLAWPATIAMLPLAVVIPAVFPDEHEPRRLIRANAEEGRDYGLGFVEFNDNGSLRAEWQLSELLDYAHSEGQTGGGIILVTFIHGWNSNCHDCNGNLECFKEVLAAIAELQRKIDSRRRHTLSTPMICSSASVIGTASAERVPSSVATPRKSDVIEVSVA